MGDNSGLAALAAEFKQASDAIAAADSRFDRRLDGLESTLNELMRKTGRPGFPGEPESGGERAQARELCITKRAYDEPKDLGAKGDYVPGSAEIDLAVIHKKAVKALWRHGDPTRLEPEFRKSLTSFSVGANDFFLPTELSNRVIRCVVDPTDVAGFVDNQRISGASIKFPVDNSRMAAAGWACEASCFANNPQPDLQEGLGELEIKAESLRFVACAGRDLLEDSAFNIEGWLLRKVEAGFRAAVSAAILVGDGIGKPLGLLNPRGGVPICETGAATALGAVTWQDLLMLKWEVPQIWHPNSAYYMNPRTWAQVMTMSDAMQRPIWTEMPGREPGLALFGSPVRILTQLPEIVAGSTPVMFGDLKAAYTLVTRSGLSMTPDIYTAGGWCVLFRFSMRCGGAPLCPNSVRLLRVR